MQSSNNFCSWADANQFMLNCDKFANGITGLIEKAQRLDSPLEAVMLSALMAAENLLECYPKKQSEVFSLMRNNGALRFEIGAGVPVGLYRADLVLSVKMGSSADWFHAPARVVIECDGHNYHERTRAQAQHDRRRDRYMQREGYIVARFTGDEIVESPFDCAIEVFELALRDLARIDRYSSNFIGLPVFERRNTGVNHRPLTAEEFYLACEVKQ